jgi:hypothetical protein
MTKEIANTSEMSASNDLEDSYLRKRKLCKRNYFITNNDLSMYNQIRHKLV